MPSLLRVPVAHTLVEVIHGQNSRKNTLVVTVEETTETSEACNTEDFGIADDGHGSSSTLQLLTALQSGRVEHRSSSDWCHDVCILPTRVE